jgi:hypothetical protein
MTPVCHVPQSAADRLSAQPPNSSTELRINMVTPHFTEQFIGQTILRVSFAFHFDFVIN